MLKKLLLCLWLVIPHLSYSQSYEDNIPAWRQAYKASIMRGNKPNIWVDTTLITFYHPNPDYCVKARVTLSKGKQVTLTNMNSKNKQKLVEYGVAEFELMSTKLKLHVYKVAKSKDSNVYDLFIPFTDLTSGSETFRWGRYLNCSSADTNDGKILLDFNKCYNPRTAYVRGYVSIMPPLANWLKIDIKAGEKAYGIDFGY